jgi:glycosyltransferase involved in cell wall biosynthesis
MGIIRRNGLIERFLRRLSGRSMQEAECVITLGEHMKETLLAHLPGPAGVSVEVIPNWADIEAIRPIPRAENPFALEHGLLGKFVVMYSGNFGATHDVESIVDAAEVLTKLPDLRFVLIGTGTRLKELQHYVRTKALTNLSLLDWLPADKVPYSLACADCLIVSLDAPFDGISIPSKTYTSLAAGAAILAVCPLGSDLATLVLEHGCGLQVAPCCPGELADAIRTLRADRPLLQRMQANARAAAESRYNVPVCTRRYRELLLPLMARP